VKGDVSLGSLHDSERAFYFHLFVSFLSFFDFCFVDPCFVEVYPVEVYHGYLTHVKLRHVQISVKLSLTLQTIQAELTLPHQGSEH
jgi:hypothetical protein